MAGRIYSEIHSGYKQAGIFADFKYVIETGISTENDRHYVGEGFDNWYATVTVKLDDGVVFSFRDITDDVVYRNKLIESETKFRSIVDQAPVATCLFVGSDMKIEIANDIMIGYWGKGPGVIGKPLADALPELQGQPFMDILNNIYITGITYSAKDAPVELVVNGVRGTYYFDFTYKPLTDTNGNTYAIMDMAVDVTERYVARKKVEASEARFRSLIEEAPIPTCLFVGPDMIITVANEAMLNTWGKGNSVLGKPHGKAIPELENQAYPDILSEVYKTGKAYEAKSAKVNLVKDDILNTHYFNFTYKPLFNNDDAVYAIMAMAVDVTEEVIGRQKIEKAEAALRGAIELAALATWSFDIRNNIFTYAPRFAEWLGLTENSKKMDEAYEFLPNNYRQSVPEKIMAAIQPGSPGIYENEHPVINRSTGQVRIIHAQAQVLYDSAGEPQFLSGTAQDITEQRKLQEELERQVNERTAELAQKAAELVNANAALQQTNTELNEFAYVASHDLQEPLRKVRTFTELMELSLESVSDKTKNYINKIQASTQRMQALINDVLRFSLLAQARECFEKVDLNVVLQNILSDYELLIEQKEARVTVSSLPSLDSIPLQMGQLFTNLVSNALKFSSPNRTLEIMIDAEMLPATSIAGYSGLNKDKSYYKLVFRDNGIGFNQENAGQIFTIFQRLHSRSEYEGTGIGLALCKKIVINHHGHIYANSKKNEGAEFVIILPASQG